MGLKSWLINKIVSKEMKKIKPSTETEAADELLKRSISQYSETLKTAQKINRANLLRQNTKQLKEEIKEGLDDDDEEEEEEEEDDEIENLFKNVLLPMITNKDKLASIDKDKLASFAAAIPPEQIEGLLKSLKLKE